MKKQSCKEIQDKWVSAQRAGAIPDEELRQIERHLKTCSACMAFVYEKNLFSLISSSRDDTSWEPSAGFYEKLSRIISATQLPDENLLFELLTVPKVPTSPIWLNVESINDAFSASSGNERLTDNPDIVDR